MQFTTTILALLATASTSLATPVPEPATGAVNMMAAAGTQWTMENFKRTCASDAKSCNYSFAINTNNGQAATACNYKVTGNPAARATYANIQCGAFRIGSTWSGQFGAGQGFQTLSVVKDKQIIYPAYKDTQLANGKTVTPNQSYTPQNLP